LGKKIVCQTKQKKYKQKVIRLFHSKLQYGISKFNS